MVERKAFLANPRLQYRASQCGEHVCSAHNERNVDYCVSKFDSFHEWTLIISKIVGRKAFLANLEHQYHVSQGGECDISAHSYRKGNYNAYSSLSHFTDKLWL